MFAERIACIVLVDQMVGPVDRPLFPFVFPNERAPVTLDVRTYIRTSRISSRKQFAVKAVDRDETESWRRKPRRGAAPASHLPGLPILRDYLSESTTFNSHRQRTTYAKRVYNVHPDFTCLQIQAGVHSTLRKSLSLSVNFLLPHSCSQA